jgi:hypothetical protein
MATVLEEYTTEEQVLLCVFLLAKGFTAKDIHKEILPSYCGKCLSRKAVSLMTKKFKTEVRKWLKQRSMLQVSTQW